MKKRSKRVVIANTFASFGYISLLFQWAWAALLLCYPLLIDRPDFLLPTPPSTQAGVIEVSPELSPITAAAAIAVTVLILAATVIALVRLPRSIGKKASTITNRAASTVIPAITQHKKITKKQRKKLSYKIGLAIKLAGITLPFVLLLFVDFSGDIPLAATWTVALFCGACSLIYFGIQQAIATIGKVDVDELW